MGGAGMSQEGRESESGGLRPRTSHMASYGWRFGRYATRVRIDRLLRFRLLGRLPRSWRSRFEAMGMPAEMVAETLRSVRSFHGWVEAWTATAQHYAGEARRAERDGDELVAAVAFQRAGLCYHVASWFTFENERIARTCRSSGISLFSRSVPLALPDTRRVEVPWRTGMLPAYLTIPRGVGPARPLVVLLNGVTTSKEELILWRRAYVDRGMAVLALDWPGTGELVGAGPPDPDHDDLTDGLIDLATHERGLDPTRVALVGFSLGGAMAVRAATLDRRIAAVVAVTPPYDIRAWADAVLPLLRDQFGAWSAEEGRLAQLAEGFALGPAVSRLRAPLLVFGAGRDLLVPPTEAVRLASAYGDNATLVWYADAGHGLYEVVDGWTADSVLWLNAVFDKETVGSRAGWSTQVDDSSGQEWSGQVPGRELPAASEAP